MTTFSAAANVLAVLLLLAGASLLGRRLAARGEWRWRSALAGALVFVLSSRVIGTLVAEALGLSPSLLAPASSQIGTLIALAAIAAACEETGKLAGLRWLGRRAAPDAAGTLSFAFGYAACELLLIGVVGHGQLIALALAPDSAAQMLEQLPEQARAHLQRALSSLDALAALWLVVERGAAFVMQALFVLLVRQAIAEGRARPFVAALLLHFAADLPAAAWQVGALPLAAIEPVYLVAGLAAYRALRIRARALRQARGAGPRRST